MAQEKENVVLAGSGDIAKYLAEEFVRDGKYHVSVISRTDREFFHQPGMSFHKVDEYTTGKIVPVLDSRPTRALISTLQSDKAEFYSSAHEAMLSACYRSKTCKRLIPSDFLGNLRDFGWVPRGNCQIRKAFRALLAQQSAIQWTFVNEGWLADYFVQPPDGSSSYVHPFPAGWPIDLEARQIRIAGTGNEPVGWTAARDMAQAIVQLMRHDEWPAYTFVFGEIGCWNEAVEKVERFYGVKLEVWINIFVFMRYRIYTLMIWTAQVPLKRISTSSSLPNRGQG